MRFVFYNPWPGFCTMAWWSLVLQFYRTDGQGLCIGPAGGGLLQLWWRLKGCAPVCLLAQFCAAILEAARRPAMCILTSPCTTTRLPPRPMLQIPAPLWPALGCLPVWHRAFITLSCQDWRTATCAAPVFAAAVVVSAVVLVSWLHCAHLQSRWLHWSAAEVLVLPYCPAISFANGRGVICRASDTSRLDCAVLQGAAQG